MYHNFIALIVNVVIRKLTTLAPKNSSLIKMSLLGKNSLEERETSIFVSSQLPHTKIAAQIYNEVASLSELKHQITVKNEAE